MGFRKAAIAKLLGRIEGATPDNQITPGEMARLLAVAASMHGGGWGYYRDSGTRAEAVAVLPGERARFLVDAAHPFTNETFLGTLTPDAGERQDAVLWRDNQVRATEIGDAYDLRVDMRVSVEGADAPCQLRLSLDIGGDKGTIYEVERTVHAGYGAPARDLEISGRIKRGVLSTAQVRTAITADDAANDARRTAAREWYAAGEPITFSVPIFTGATFVPNDGEIYLTASAPVRVWDRAVFIKRTSSPVS